MQITKFGQSCILIETNNKKILIDPGIFLFDDSVLNYWKAADIILITHKHADHCNQEVIKEIVNDKTKIYSSSEVKNSYQDLPIKIIKAGDTIKDQEVEIEVVKAVHGYLPKLKGKGEIFENIGFILKIENKKIYISSDTIGFNNDYKCDVLILPVSGHGLVMGPFEASLFAKETGANLIIPTHMDNPLFPVDLEDLKRNFDRENLNYRILDLKETIKL